MKVEAIDKTIKCSEFGENLKTRSEKIDIDISKQFIDENGVHERKVYLENLFKNNSFQDYFLIKRVIENSEFEEFFKAHSGKIEDIDISEQFIDENGVHERIVHLENVENNLKNSFKNNSFHDYSSIKRTIVCSEFGENFKTRLEKIEDDISEQFIDENGVHERMVYLENVGNNLENPFKSNSFHEFSSIKRTIECSEFGENFKTHLEKIEDIDISEQFIDENVVHERRVYLENVEKDLTNPSKHNSSKKKKHIKSINSNLNEHMCNLCDYATKWKGTLKVHVDTVHLKLKKYKCPLCVYAVNRRDILKKHIESVHLELKGHKCHLCDYASNQKIHLKQHIESVHFELKKHKCHLCDYASNLKMNLIRHLNTIHLNLKKHKCHLCEYASNLKINLKQHIQFVHLNLKEHKCHLCDYASNYKVCLKRHTEVVHLNFKKHKCHLCDYAVSRKSILKQHIESVHLKLRKHKCHLCDYASNYTLCLKRHIDSVHLNLKQHKCHLCDYAANVKDDIKRHINSVHKSHEC